MHCSDAVLCTFDRRHHSVNANFLTLVLRLVVFQTQTLKYFCNVRSRLRMRKLLLRM